MKLLIFAVFCITVMIGMPGCNLGEVELNAPNLSATYEGQSKSGYKATVNGAESFYSTITYICVDGFLYLRTDPGIVLGTCEDVAYSYIAIVNTRLGFIE